MIQTTAGASARHQFDRSRSEAVQRANERDIFGLLVLALLPLATYLLIHYGLPRLQAVVVTSLVCVALVLWLRGGAAADFERARAWAVGAAGEEATAAVLEPLRRQGISVFHDVVVPGRRENVDHLLVGPFGAVVVETKRWKGRVVVGRRALRVGWRSRNDAIGQVERLQGAVERWLDVPVGSVVCIHGARVRPAWFRLRSTVRGVEVAGADRLLRAVRRARPRAALSRAEVTERCDEIESELAQRR